MFHYLKCSLFFLLMGLSLAGYAQKVKLKVVSYDRDASFFHKKYKVKKEYNSEQNLKNDLSDLINKLQAKGYMMASVDSLVQDSLIYTAYILVGDRYTWQQLEPGNVPEEMLDEAGYKAKLFNGTDFNYKELDLLLERILVYCENNGYPFAAVEVDSFTISGTEVSARLKLDKNQLIVYDTIAVVGDVRITQGYLGSYLGIKKGKPYNEKVVRRVSKRMNELEFMRESRSPKVVFVEDKAKLYLYLEDKKASQFDFILGLLPNSETTGKFLLTGQADLRLVNPFGIGEEFTLNWRKMQPRTQKLDVGFEYPYVVNLPFGVEANFSLYKRDTIYLDLIWDVGVRYLFVGGNYFEAFFENYTTNVLNVDSTEVINNRSLPSNLDVRNSQYGLEYYFEKLDYRINPREGWRVKLRASLGIRKVKENSDIAQINDPENPGETFGYLYDSIDTRAIQYRFRYQLDRFWPIGRRMTLLTGFSGGAVVGDNIFNNELFRIGGINLLRGFDEEDIWVSMYHIGKAEFRFLISSNSFVNLFFDAAYVEDRSLGQYSNDWPYGFGAGISFDTKAGMFSVNYAYGSQRGNPIDFRSAKVHFGYVNNF